MSTLRSIQLAIEQATRQRDQLSVALVHVQRSVQLAQEQLHQLQSYGSETDARWVTPAAHCVSLELVRHRYQFMDRLQQAIGLQQGVMAQHGQQLEQLRQQLVAAEIRLAGLQRVLEQRAQALEHVRRRRDQARTDEFAAMQYARQKSGTATGEHYGC